MKLPDLKPIEESFGTISNWKPEQLKVIKKGKKGQGGQGGGPKPSNVEIEMEPGEEDDGDDGELTQEDIEDILDGMADDHEPGDEAGKKSDTGDDVTEADIDDLNKQIEEEIGKGGKKAKGGDPGKDEGEGESPGSNQENQKGGGGLAPGQAMNKNLKKVEPTFNWKQLIQRFIMSRKPMFEETYTKVNPKGITGAHVAAQLGAGAIKPGIKQLDEVVDAKLGFVIDSSAGMNSVISTVMANAIALLKQPMFKKATVTVVKYSGKNSMHKVMFGQDKAASVTDANEKPKTWPIKASEVVFGTHIGAGTQFDAALTGRIESMLKLGYNVIFFPDNDIMAGANLVHFISLFKAHAQNVFVVFDSHATYIQFREKVGTSTANITYFPSKGK